MLKVVEMIGSPRARLAFVRTTTSEVEHAGAAGQAAPAFSFWSFAGRCMVSSPAEAVR